MRKVNFGDCVLYNCDCMDLMAQYPDKHFELAIVDPPYGVGSVTYMPSERFPAAGGFIDKYEVIVATFDMNQRKNMKVNIAHKKNTHTTIQKFGDNNVSPPPAYFKELFRVSKHQIIWGGNYFLLPPSRCFIIWRKPTVAESFSMAMCEMAWTSYNANAKLFECPPMGLPGERIHPTQKPIALYKWLLSNYAQNGDKILDTHMGSGTLAVACWELGFALDACEIDEEYYNGACRYIEQATKQQKLPFIGDAV